MTYSPAPWQWNDPANFKQGYGKFSEIAVYATGRAFPWRMCEVSGPSDDVAIANARLIAAAPCLLEALEEAERHMSGMLTAIAGGNAESGRRFADNDPVVVKVRTAIAKARGAA